MKKLKTTFRHFKETFKTAKDTVVTKLKDDEGAEMIEIAIGICLAVVLIVVVIAIINKARNKASEANDAIDQVTW